MIVLVKKQSNTDWWPRQVKKLLTFPLELLNRYIEGIAHDSQTSDSQMDKDPTVYYEATEVDTPPVVFGPYSL